MRRNEQNYLNKNMFRRAQKSVFYFFILAGITLSTESHSFGTPSLDTIDWPKDTPNTEAAINLGRHLFFDPRLVLNEQQSCASCHSPHMGYADGLAQDLSGHKDWKRATRNSPSLYNLAWAPVLHWDGRTPDGQCFTAEDTKEKVCLAPLESQAFKSMRSRKIYKGFLPKVKAEPEYQRMFKEAFPPNGEITHINMARAIAAFERSIVSNDSAFDRYLAGDEAAMSAEAKRGFELFQGKANCTRCHNGENFTDWLFHNIGVKSDDPGRAKKVKSEEEKKEFQGAFKTPGLRNTALTPPYMHNGSLGSLEEVIAFYNRGGDNKSNLSPLMEPLDLSPREQWDLVAFLHALTDPIETKIPVIPGLKEETTASTSQ